MDRSEKTVFVDEEVQSAILSIIRNAKKYVVVVTPYVGLVEPRGQWHLAQQAVKDAITRGVRMTFVVRKDWTNEKEALDDLEWLLESKVDVRTVDRLHAKIYLNESSLLVSSMNLKGSSASGSLETRNVCGAM